MTENKKSSRFNILGEASETEILSTKESNKTPEVANSKLSAENEENNGPASTTGLKFNQPTLKASKKDNKKKNDQIKDRATINVSEPTRTRLKIFCATNKFVLQNWADEVLWKAMEKHEKTLREAKDKKE